MHCDGKCQFMKKIKEQEEKEKQQAPELKLAKTEIFTSHSFFPGFFPKPLSAEISYYDLLESGVPVDRATALFHPPGTPSQA